MKKIKIFLASSIVEFEIERTQLGDFLNEINSKYIDRGIYIELVKCEYVSNAIGQVRKQAEYDAMVEDCDLFYLLVGVNIGDYTIEEFDVAIDAYRQNGSPRVYTYFKRVEDESQIADNVKAFMVRLSDDLGHYYTYFEHIDSVKLNILMGIAVKEGFVDDLTFSDGNLMHEQDKLCSLANLPMYSGNKSITSTAKKVEELSSEMAKAAVAYGSNPDDSKLMSKMLEVSDERSREAAILNELESNLFNLYKEIYTISEDGSISTDRIIKANELLMSGDYDGALAILEDGVREDELAVAEQMHEASEQAIKGYYAEELEKIRIYKTRIMTDDNYGKLVKSYDRIVNLTIKYGFDKKPVIEYAKFLKAHFDRQKSVDVLSEYIKGLNKEADLEVKELFMNCCAMEGSDVNYEVAVKLYESLNKEYDNWEEELKKSHKESDKQSMYDYLIMRIRFVHDAALIYRRKRTAKESAMLAKLLVEEGEHVQKLIDLDMPISDMNIVVMPMINSISLYENINRKKAESIYEDAKKWYAKLSDPDSVRDSLVGCTLKYKGLIFAQDKDATYEELIDELRKLYQKDPMMVGEQHNQMMLYYGRYLSEGGQNEKAAGVFKELITYTQVADRHKEAPSDLQLEAKISYAVEQSRLGRPSALEDVVSALLGRELGVYRAYRLIKDYPTKFSVDCIHEVSKQYSSYAQMKFDEGDYDHCVNYKNRAIELLEIINSQIDYSRTKQADRLNFVMDMSIAHIELAGLINKGPQEMVTAKGLAEASKHAGLAITLLRNVESENAAIDEYKLNYLYYNAYFELGKSYYISRKYGKARKNFKKAADYGEILIQMSDDVNNLRMLSVAYNYLAILHGGPLTKNAASKYMGRCVELRRVVADTTKLPEDIEKYEYVAQALN